MKIELLLALLEPKIKIFHMNLTKADSNTWIWESRKRIWNWNESKI